MINAPITATARITHHSGALTQFAKMAPLIYPTITVTIIAKIAFPIQSRSSSNSDLLNQDGYTTLSHERTGGYSTKIAMMIPWPLVVAVRGQRSDICWTSIVLLLESVCPKTCWNRVRQTGTCRGKAPPSCYARPFCRLKAPLGLSLFCFAPQTRSYLVDAILSVGHDLLRAP